MVDLIFIPEGKVDKVEDISAFGLKARARPIETVHIPIIPKDNDCCKGVCELVNNDIKDKTRDIRFAQQELDTLSPGKLSAKTRRGMNVLLAQVTVMKDFRLNMLDKDICKCIKIKKPERPTLPVHVTEASKIIDTNNKRKDKLIFIK